MLSGCKSKKLSLPCKYRAAATLRREHRFFIQQAKNTFVKKERLSSKQQIDLLFARGRHIQAPPLKLVYLNSPGQQPFPASAMFVVPKRAFKKAHERNKLKRRMKEAYRMGKKEFYVRLQLQDKKLTLAFIYTAKQSESFRVIERAILKLLENCSG